MAESLADANGELAVQIEGGGGEPTRLLMLSRPAGGQVRVREWSDLNWTGAPSESTRPVREVLDEIERAYHQRRRLSYEIAAIRAWLDGRNV